MMLRGARKTRLRAVKHAHAKHAATSVRMCKGVIWYKKSPDIMQSAIGRGPHRYGFVKRNTSIAASAGARIGPVSQPSAVNTLDVLSENPNTDNMVLLIQLSMHASSLAKPVLVWQRRWYALIRVPFLLGNASLSAACLKTFAPSLFLT